MIVQHSPSAHESRVVAEQYVMTVDGFGRHVGGAVAMVVAVVEPEPVPLARDGAGRLVVIGTRVPLDTLVARIRAR